MRADDAELELFRREVSCAALLERWPTGWRLDRRESTRNALKYRRGAGEILIINHNGHGWWDPQGSAKGDVFDLVRYLDPSLNFAQVRKELRRLVGAASTLSEALRPSPSDVPDRPVAERWNRRPRLRPRSPAWSYLCEKRRIPASILTAAGRSRHRAGWSVRQCLVRPSRRSRRCQSRRDPRPGLQGLLEGRDQGAVPVRPGREGGVPARRHRGSDRRLELGRDRRPSHRHALPCHRRRHRAGDDLRSPGRDTGRYFLSGCLVRRSHGREPRRRSIRRAPHRNCRRGTCARRAPPANRRD